MQCHDARRLLGLDVQPGTADALRTDLGFHLSSCETCRAYRAHLHDQQLLNILLTQVSVSSHIPARTARHALRNRAAYGLRAAGTALLVGSTLALTGLGGGTVQAANVAPEPRPVPASQHAANLGRLPGRTSGNAAVRGVRAGNPSDVVNSIRSDAASARSVRIAEQANQVVAAESAAIDLRTPTEEDMQLAALQVGMEIQIPSLPLTAAELAAGPVGQTITYTTYVVQAGDTLSSIAMRFYNNASLWNYIYKANPNVVSDAHWIYPGQRLIIPTLQQSPDPGSGSSPVNQGGYVVQAGDTLSTIALRAYGNATFWPAIYQANRTLIANYNLIYPGQRFTIPAAPQIGQGMPGSSQQPVGSVTQPAPARTYTVQSGDTLSTIALRAYGNGNLWSMIYHANQGVVGDNPNMIYPGQQLSIPAMT